MVLSKLNNKYLYSSKNLTHTKKLTLLEKNDFFVVVVKVAHKRTFLIYLHN